LADFLVNELEMNVVAIAGPQGESLLEELKGYSTDSSRIYSAWDLTIPQLAAAVYGSRLLISNDTGPMHLGPILGIPTLGLFSIGLPEHFRPAGNTNRFLQSDPIEAISVEAVVNEVREMCAIARPDPRR
jgi:ADP-heptose:LPS heptosyltransferase